VSPLIGPITEAYSRGDPGRSCIRTGGLTRRATDGGVMGYAQRAGHAPSKRIESPSSETSDFLAPMLTSNRSSRAGHRQRKCLQAGLGPQRRDGLAGHVGLELGNVVTNYPLKAQ
jgi:hypothetical protein